MARPCPSPHIVLAWVRYSGNPFASTKVLPPSSETMTFTGKSWPCAHGETVEMTRVRPSASFCGRTRQWWPLMPACHLSGKSAFQVAPPSEVAQVPSSIAAP